MILSAGVKIPPLSWVFDYNDKFYTLNSTKMPKIKFPLWKPWRFVGNSKPRHEMVVVSFTYQPLYPQRKSSCYPLNSRLHGPRSRYGRFGEQTKSLAPCQKHNHNSSFVQPLQQSLYRLRYAASFSKKRVLKFTRMRCVGLLSAVFRGAEKTYSIKMSLKNTLGHAVAQLVEALCYNPEGRGFDWFNPSCRTMALG